MLTPMHLSANWFVWKFHTVRGLQTNTAVQMIETYFVTNYAFKETSFLTEHTGCKHTEMNENYLEHSDVP